MQQGPEHAYASFVFPEEIAQLFPQCNSFFRRQSVPLVWRRNHLLCSVSLLDGLYLVLLDFPELPVPDVEDESVQN